MIGHFWEGQKIFHTYFHLIRYFSKKAQLSEKAWAYLLCNILGIKLQNFSLNWITYPFTTLIRLKIKYIIKFKRSFEFAVDLRDRQVIYQHIRFTSVVSALLKIVWLWTIHIISNYLVKENKIPPWLCKFLFLFSVLVLSMFSVGLIATKCNHKCYHISLKKAKITRVTLPSQ